MQHRHESTSFKESSSGGVRDVIIEADATHPWRARLRYVPLSVLVCLSLGVAGLGAVVKLQERGSLGGHLVESSEVTVPGTMPDDSQIKVSAPQACFTLPPALTTNAWSGPDAPALQATLTNNTGTNYWIAGQDGQIFLGDVHVHNIAQAVGAITLTPAQVASWQRLLGALSDASQQVGATFVVMPSPAKWDIYPETLPAWTAGMQGNNVLNQLIRSTAKYTWVDSRAAIRDGKSLNPVFSKVNSHWNPFGAYLGYEQLAKCLGAVNSQFKDLSVPEIASISLNAGPNEYTGQGNNDQSQDWAVPQYAQALPQFEFEYVKDGQEASETVDGTTEVDLTQLPARTTNAQGKGKLLIFRDSTGGAISPLLSQAFHQTVQVAHDIGKEQLPDFAQIIAQEKPDVVLFLFAERYAGIDKLPVQ